MSVERSEKIRTILARITELRKRADAATDPATKFELHGLISSWQSILDSYRLVQDGQRFLSDVRERRSAAATIMSGQREPIIKAGEESATANGYPLRIC